MWPSLLRRTIALEYRAERLELLDGDFIDLAWTKDNGGPIALVLHGLAGSANSSYAKGLCATLQSIGWTAVVVQFRGCSAEPNRLVRSYHAGDTGDMAFAFEHIQRRYPARKFAAIGYSLGGNALLKWLGEGESPALSAAVAVSVPFDLGASADTLNRGFTRIYQRYLIVALSRALTARPQALEPAQSAALLELNSGSDFWEFDDRITAPLHGFKDVHDYYQRCSSSQYLQHIKVPTLLLQALDDPFVAPNSVPNQRDLPECITLELSDRGGHVGFIAQCPRSTLKPMYWLEQRIPSFLSATVP